ncbi:MULTISPECIES: zinc-dependent alcohol dehydrogenase family protein [unclassified Sphingomonas]|jgi:NADPH:quinone reductase-like Zn-dependent oxidoreductase|uniref:zinc-dependent alcohol dehydrogenase family protein n=1 Tax=unclassified Sphingomonas TaxID=196159 RepID=UPI00082F638C|nr:MULTISPECIES: NAD(P)-dependent alcohol dehydrogenase [unclassified Sphingomonas]
MKAIRLPHPPSIDALHAAELPDPGNPGPGEVRVRIHATSLNYHDYVVVTGGIPTLDGRIPMSDGAGVVEAVGAGVSAFNVGDSVISVFFPDWRDGRPGEMVQGHVPGDHADGFARMVVVAPAHHFTRAPKGWSHVEAATLPCAALTAWRAVVVEGQVKPGDIVLVQGSGGVSIFALQFAKAMGATVIATSSSGEKLERLKALGADHLINYGDTPNWGMAAMAASGGGVDLVVEVGGAGTMGQSIAAARFGGHIALIGVLAGHVAPLPTTILMMKQLRVTGITVGTHRQQREMIRALEATGIRPVIDATRFTLETLPDAFRHQASGAHFGKIAVEIG